MVPGIEVGRQPAGEEQPIGESSTQNRTYIGYCMSSVANETGRSQDVHINGVYNKPSWRGAAGWQAPGATPTLASGGGVKGQNDVIARRCRRP